MKISIRQLIIWPDNPALTPRTINFNLEKINVITGWSATGKSSIVAIVDYVLGSGTCAIPVGVIRDHSSWYGLLIDTAAGSMRIARKKPEGRQVSNVYWLQQGSDVEGPLPSAPIPTITADLFRLKMDTLSGLTNLSIDTEEQRGFFGRASFRDMAAFNFLPQHIVANPYTMFFKADSSEHREKLRNILPLALGVVTNDDLMRRHQVQLLREQLRVIDAELRTRRNGIENWRSNATGAFYRAQELNLLPPGEPPSDLRGILAVLQQVVAANGRLVIADDRVSTAVERLENIRQQERELDSRLSTGRRRLRRLKSLRTTVLDYEGVLEDQASRVRGAGWLKEAIVDDHCILCGSDSDAAKRSIEELDEPIRELSELRAGTFSTRPIVDNEIVALQRELQSDERALVDLRLTRLQFEATVDAERGQSQSLEAVYRFLGNIEQALKILGDVEGDGGLEERRRNIVAQIDAISRELNERDRRGREERVRERTSTYIERFIESLDIEGAAGKPVLDERELNLKFLHDTARPDFLWEIGSAQNWMAYHLATMLALQGIFLEREDQNPVPTFLIIDQPSQVYFPSDTFDDVIDGVTNPAATRIHRHLNDLESTRQIFRSLARAHRSFGGRLQLIILEHADRNAWGEISGISEVENWRGDSDYLIPRGWING